MWSICNLVPRALSYPSLRSATELNYVCACVETGEVWDLNYRVSQKFVPLISCNTNFRSKLYFYIKFLEDVYLYIESMYAEFQ